MPADALLWALLIGVVAALLLLAVLLLRERGHADLERTLRAESLTNRGELADSLVRLQKALGEQITNVARLQHDQLLKLTETNERKLSEVRATLEAKLRDLQTDNAAKLEEMRRTVDEKLQQTLEKRLGESFKLVSERLEAVHKGLGEMQTLAAGVGDLKKVLTNVKTRGTWGEVQLDNLLEQVLTAEQYARNVATRPGSNERVEFAIRLPGVIDHQPVWLPIDAKFPREDYERLLDAQDRADAAGAETAAKDLENRIRLEAKCIREKYVEPPYTTDFGLLFLPTEGLYAEVLRRPGLTDSLQRDARVVIAGPTTLTAILNSLQMGFRTLAIEKRSSEVWQLLGAVKTEFGKYGELLARTKKQLETVTNTLGDAESKTRTIERKLRNVEQLSDTQARLLLEQTADNGESP
jgi:DNA recombination protein RmuC